MSALLTVSSLSDRMQGIRGHFAEGGRWGDLVVVMIGLAGCLLLLALIHVVQQAAGRRAQDHPGRLFHSVLSGLGLTASQCRTLRRMAADLGLKHPTVMLLSPQCFRDQAEAWAKRRANAPSGELEAIAQQIFRTGPTDQEPP